MFPEVNTILEHFLKHPTESIHLRELARQTGFSPAGCRKAVKRLVKQALVLESKTPVVTNYGANRDNQVWTALKRAYNLFSLYDSGLVEALRKTYEEPEAIVLFGSYSRGEDTEQSDIDIAVITNLEKSFGRKSFEKTVARPINLIEVDLSRAKKEFINSLANGVILHGYLIVR